MGTEIFLLISSQFNASKFYRIREEWKLLINSNYRLWKLAPVFYEKINIFLDSLQLIVFAFMFIIVQEISRARNICLVVNNTSKLARLL